MRRRITWRSAAAISMLGLAPGIGAAFAVPAGASTNACLAALGPQCGTFTESAYNATTPHTRTGIDGGPAWDVKGQSSASNTPLIEYPNYTPGTDPGTDLTKVEHIGPLPGSPSAASVRWYSIVYTPNGKWTSMCVANPDNKGAGGTNLVLRSCNQQKWQAFMAVAPIAASPQTSPPTNVLPPAPTTSDLIDNPSSSTAEALYSVANKRFVEVTRPRRMSAADSRRPPGILSATGRTRETVTVTTGTVTTKNAWFWTSAAGAP